MGQSPRKSLIGEDGLGPKEYSKERKSERRNEYSTGKHCEYKTCKWILLLLSSLLNHAWFFWLSSILSLVLPRIFQRLPSQHSNHLTDDRLTIGFLWMTKVQAGIHHIDTLTRFGHSLASFGSLLLIVVIR